MKRIVFAGPSLHKEDQARATEIEFRGPARKGDLLIAARDGAGIIGLVDGYFEVLPSVWHKEILYCLSVGIIVAGAASMGALRAAECAPFGMIGIGTIFEDYLSGRRTADADVAVQHAPAELRHAALTLALVDAEETIWRMSDAGVINMAEAEAALAIAQAMHFKDRSWEELLERLADAGTGAGRFRENLPSFKVDRKREDCRELIDFVRNCPLDEAKACEPSFDLQHSAFLAGLMQAVGQKGA